MTPVKARLIQHIGTRFYLRVFTYSTNGICSANSDWGCDAQIYLKTTDVLHDNRYSKASQYAKKKFPWKCDKCGKPFPPSAIFQIHRVRHYNTASGDPEIGDLYYATWLEGTRFYWDNMEGPHLFAVCPGGLEWNIDSRASNCTQPEERTHRCWVRHGTPPEITVDKNGHTCQAGGGSIQTRNWHGFLSGGYFKLDR